MSQLNPALLRITQTKQEGPKQLQLLTLQFRIVIRPVLSQHTI